MATHMIPRDTKGEGRILFIFSTKALIYTVVGARYRIPFSLDIKCIGNTICRFYIYCIFCTFAHDKAY